MCMSLLYCIPEVDLRYYTIHCKRYILFTRGLRSLWRFLFTAAGDFNVDYCGISSFFTANIRACQCT